MLQTLVNDLTTTDFLLLLLVFFSFFRTMLDFVKLFNSGKHTNKRS